MKGNDPSFVEAARLAKKFFPEAKSFVSPEVGLEWDAFLGAMMVADYTADHSCYPFRSPSDPDLGLSDKGGLDVNDSEIYLRLLSHADMVHHFVDVETGQPIDDCEVSCLDSAIFFNGCMVAAEAFGGSVKEMAVPIIDRADWEGFPVKHPKTGKQWLAFRIVEKNPPSDFACPKLASAVTEEGVSRRIENDQKPLSQKVLVNLCQAIGRG